MASFNRADYEFCVKVARFIYAADMGNKADEMAKDLFQRCENVIGQQSPPLEEQPDTTP